jgi:hypothetical protein
MVSGDKNSDICPTLVNFIATLEQQFITIDDLLDEENVDPFMDDEIELVMTVSIGETSKSHMSIVPGVCHLVSVKNFDALYLLDKCLCWNRMGHSRAK